MEDHHLRAHHNNHHKDLHLSKKKKKEKGCLLILEDGQARFEEDIGFTRQVREKKENKK